MKRLLAAYVIALFLFSLDIHDAWSTHASVGTGIGHAGPITTISASTLAKGALTLQITSEFQKFDTFSDARLLELGSQGFEDIHNVNSLHNIFFGIAYGVTQDLTLHARIPYVYRSDISELHHDEDTGIDEIERLGDSQGIGDLSVIGHCRFLNLADYNLEAAGILGVKMPTGNTSDKDAEGNTFEAEFLPGSGSWDTLYGLAVTKRFGRLSLDTSVLYTVVTEGTQDTDLGDAFNYNAALSYKALRSTVSIDIILEANGIWRAKQKIAGERDDNSGGTIIFVSPGLRASVNRIIHAFVSIGIPVLQDLNGKQNEINYRTVVGLGAGF